MLTFEQIKELVELVSSHRLAGVELERSGFRLKIEGKPAVAASPLTAPAAGPGAPGILATPAAGKVAAPPAAPSTMAGETAPEPAREIPPGAGPPAVGRRTESKAAGSGLPTDAHVVSSPIVGTYYAAPNPDAKPFVRIGDRVEQGQVLCIVEAMKLMNEIECDVDGVVLEIYPQNAQPVEYGEPLFAIRPG